jgi:serine phosphatase RsbU (regulator of sigma subunit)
VTQAPDTTARLDALLDATQTGEWAWDFATGEITWSPTLGPLHGKPRGWAPADYEEWKALIHPEDLPALDEAAQRARDTGAGYELEFRAAVPDGSIRWLWTRAGIVRDGEERLVGVTRDVTDRRRRDDTERFISRASQVLLATTSADAALQQLCDLAAAEVADWCLVQQVSDKRPADVLAVSHRDPGRTDAIRALHEREPLPENATEEPLADVISTRTTARVVLSEIGTELVAPVLSEGRHVSALLVLGNAPSSRRLDEHDVALAEALGRRTAVALERLRLLEAERGAARRTEALQRVGALLSAAATAEDVLRVAIEAGLATIGASGGSIAYPQRGVAAMRRVTAGYSPEDAAGAWDTVPFDAELPGPQAARTGAAVWLTDRENAEQEFPLLLEVFAHTPWGSLCALPLAVGVRRGFFVAFFDDPREFGPDDRAFTEAIVTLCAQALERARLLDETAHARDVARRLQALTAALSAAATPEDVCAAVLSAGLEAIGAEGALIYVREGADARLVASVGFDDEISAAWSSIPTDARVPVSDVLATGDTVVFSSPEDAKRRYPALADTPERHGARPSVLVPMGVGASTTGALCVSFATVHVVEDDDVVFVQAVGRLCAQALERARLLEAERVTSERLERLQAVTALLGSAMTVDEVARIVVHEGVAAVDASAGALVLALDDGSLETVSAVGYSDDVLELYRRFAPTDPVVAARVYREGRPLWVESLEEMEADYPAHELALDPHLEAEAFIPLRLAGGTLGVLMISFEGARSLAADERELLLTLARQCAQAVANARVFERDHRIAEQLQRALLPPSLEVPYEGCVAVRYLCGSAEADVGGDWYDLALRPDGRLGGSVGDVAGKGVLAASRMGQLRTVQRAHSVDGLSPSAVASRLNGLVEATDSFFATLVAFDLDQDSGELRYCSAGHLPPLLLTADGRCEFLSGGESLPLGVAADTSYEEARTVLEHGDLVLFYTDGLVERPGLGIDEALERLCETVVRLHGCDPEELLNRLLGDLVGNRLLQDDVAVLVLQRAG